jgi:hypothetical protein
VETPGEGVLSGSLYFRNYYLICMFDVAFVGPCGRGRATHLEQVGMGAPAQHNDHPCQNGYNPKSSGLLDRIRDSTIIMHTNPIQQYWSLPISNRLHSYSCSSTTWKGFASTKTTSFVSFHMGVLPESPSKKYQRCSTPSIVVVVPPTWFPMAAPSISDFSNPSGARQNVDPDCMVSWCCCRLPR